MTALLEDPSVVILGHNIAYDLLCLAAFAFSLDQRLGDRVLSLIFEAYAADRIRDTDYRERLLAIAQGEFAEDRDISYSLETIAKKRLRIRLDKDTHRHKYGALVGTDPRTWTEGQRKYASDDAAATLLCYEHQEAYEGEHYRTNHPVHAVWHEHHVCRKAWTLMLMRAWGVRTDAEAVAELEARLLEEERAIMRDLVQAGILEKHPKKNEYTKKTKRVQERVAAAYMAKGLAVPMSAPSTKFPGGQIKTDADTCEDSGDPVLERVAEYNGVTKILDTYVPALKSGIFVPVNAWWNAQLVSDRTSCSGPNWQNPPQAFGVRQCVRPRLGVLSSVDYDTIELKALANFNYEMFGFSRMRDRICQGIDLHTALGARLINVPYEEMKANKNAPHVAKGRKMAKATNFGRPGGMGDRKFVEMAKKQYNLHFTIPEAKAQKAIWLEENPEMVRFFAHVASLTKSGYGTVITPASGMVRGGCTFPAACNQHFQGPVAYGATDAAFYVAWECYVDKGTALFGCRPTLFLHDELILDIPTHKAHEAALRQTEVMVERMQRIFPHVPITASPALMLRWYKEADAQFQDKAVTEGPAARLIPWEYACVRELGTGLQKIAA
jgi:hypothetical protein